MRVLSLKMALLIGVTATGGCGQWGSPTRPRRAETEPQVGQPAPEIEGEDIDGSRFKLSDYRGKIVVLDFWGDW